MKTCTVSHLETGKQSPQTHALLSHYTSTRVYDFLFGSFGLKEPRSGVIRKACCVFPGSLGRFSLRVSRPGASRSSGDPSVLEC